MYPSFVDMNEIESSKSLRMLELDAYSNVLAALRAQGPPTIDKLKLLKDIAIVLHIPQERCKAEIRKVVLDEKLNTIAYYTCGQVETSEEWVKEGRRLIAIVPRSTAESIYSVLADEVAEAASLHNEQLPLPAHTERKRAVSQPETSSKSHQFKVPECLKNDDSKKRKVASLGVENSMLAQHLIGTSKIGKVQQIYRQKNKSKIKDHHVLLPAKSNQDPQSKLLQTRTTQPSPPPNTSPKINILQNIALPAVKKEEEEQHQDITVVEETAEINAPEQPVKLVNLKPANIVAYNQFASPSSGELPKSVKICTAGTRKQVTKTTIPGQKLVIVSNAQTITTPGGILQRTLTIPFKNISVKNLDKFKIVSTATNSPLQLNSTVNTTNKHKVVTVKSNTKKVIPLAHLQALNAKGGLKMYPIRSKLLTAVSPPAYVTSNLEDGQADTKSTTSTPVIMTCRPLESPGENTEDKSEKTERRNSESLIDDIESQITQLTAIPQTLPEKILSKDDSVGVSEEKDQSQLTEDVNCSTVSNIEISEEKIVLKEEHASEQAASGDAV